MTQHHIVRSEAHLPSAHVNIVLHRPRRRHHARRWVFGGAAALGAVSSLVDSAIGTPVCLIACCALFAALWIWPGAE